jgi:hypothetical protein
MLIISYSWVNTLATSLISITAVSLIFVTTSTTILTSVPVDVKSLCGGMVSLIQLFPKHVKKRITHAFLLA